MKNPLKEPERYLSKKRTTLDLRKNDWRKCACFYDFIPLDSPIIPAYGRYPTVSRIKPCSFFQRYFTLERRRATWGQVLEPGRAAISVISRRESSVIEPLEGGPREAYAFRWPGPSPSTPAIALLDCSEQTHSGGEGETDRRWGREIVLDTGELHPPILARVIEKFDGRSCTKGRNERYTSRNLWWERERERIVVPVVRTRRGWMVF